MPYRKLYFAAALTGLLVLAFVATSIISYYIARESLHARISEQTLPLTSDNIYSEIERDLLRSILIASLMAHDTFVRDWVLRGETDPGSIVRYLRQIQRKYDATTAFFVSERSRRYYHPDGVLREVRSDRPGDGWYFRVRNLDDPYEINVDRDTADPGRVTIFVNYRVRDYDGNYIGVTGIGHSVDSVSRLIRTYQARYGVEIRFVDRNGRVQLDGEADAAGERGRIQDEPGLRTVATRLLTNPSTSTQYTTADGRTAHVNSRLLPELGWYLVVEQVDHAAEVRILNTLALNVGIALLVTLLVVTTAWFTVRGYQMRLEAMATTDALTGATNRQVFEMLFNQVTRTARRTGTAVSLVAVDLDRFKAINDEHGHAAGDAVLQAVTRSLRGTLREADSICRWGGDEFLILMADCDAAGARNVADKIRASLHAHSIRAGDATVDITVSMGVAQHAAGESLEALIQRADEALYAAKAAGRDRAASA